MIERNQYLDDIKNLIDKNVIKVLTGVRRCGKSTLLYLIKDYLKKQGISEDNIIYVDLEAIDFLNITTINQLNDYIQSQIKDKSPKFYLFLDEVQRIENWEKLVNSYFSSKNFDIYITGSNANLLSGEFASYLTGRYMEIKVYPFSFKEYLKYYKNSNLSKKELFNEYLKFGGMPVSFEFNNSKEKNQYLSDLSDSIIYKDIIKRFNIHDINLFSRLITFVYSNIGQLVSASSIVKYLKKDQINVSVNTIYNYLSYMEEACLIYKVKREDLFGKKLLNHLEKYYLVDIGFRQAIFSSNLRDIGQSLENIVYIELLRRGYKVNIGKFKDKEIDFVCTKENKKIYVQVSYILTDDKTIKREFAPLLNIKDNYPKYVMSLDEFDMSRDGIIHLNIMDFLCENEL